MGRVAWASILRAFKTTLTTPNVLFCFFSALADLPPLYVQTLDVSTPVRILLWTSWIWMLLRARYFRVNSVEESDEAALIEKNKQFYLRAGWKLVLFVICIACLVGDAILNFVVGDNLDLIDSRTWNASIDANSLLVMHQIWTQTANLCEWWGVTSSLLFLWGHLILWECFEDFMLAHKTKEMNSISKFIARSSNQNIKRLLELYALLLTLLVWRATGRYFAGLFGFGMFCLLMVKTESMNIHSDDFQTFTHCSGMILVMIVSTALSTPKPQIFWIVKFTSIMPYFFQFMTSLPTHTKLKMRAEIKMFKHLGDLIILVQ